MSLPLPHLYSGKVRDIYAVGDDQLLMVTSDRLSAFDVVLDEPILHKGRVLTAISAFWFEALGRRGRQPPRVHRRRRPPDRGRRRRPRPGRPDHAVPQGRDARRSSASSAATCRARPGRSTRPAARCTARRCPPGCRRAISSRSRCSRRRRRATSTTRTSPSSGPSTSSVRSWPHAARDISLELYSPRRRHGSRARDHHRRHQVRARARRRRARAVRRGDDARLQPLLARRRVEAGHHPAELRQAAGARLPRRARLGQDPAAAAAPARGGA